MSWFPNPKKFKLSPIAGKVIKVAFWDSRGIILAHVMPKGRTKTARYYSEENTKNITKTHLFKYIENFTSKNWKFSDKKTLIFFHISAQNIDCGYSLEPPRRGGSNEYQ